MATVAKPFNSITQRFKLGADVSEADDLSPLSFADLKTRGFIATSFSESSAFAGVNRPVAVTEE